MSSISMEKRFFGFFAGIVVKGWKCRHCNDLGMIHLIVIAKLFYKYGGVDHFAITLAQKNLAE